MDILVTMQAQVVRESRRDSVLHLRLTDEKIESCFQRCVDAR
jgi:hypothetical protein